MTANIPKEKLVSPLCPHFGLCGGCSWQNMKNDFQIELKEKMAQDAFAKYDLNLCQIQSICAKEYGYRCRVQMHQGGFLQKKTNNIIYMTECPVCEKPIEDYMKATTKEQRPQNKVQIFGSEFLQGKDKLVICKQMSQDFAESFCHPKGVRGKSKRKIKIKQNRHFAGTLQGSPTVCTVSLGGKEITFDARGFFQSNLFMTQKTASIMQRTIEQTFPLSRKINLIDIYSGCGTFSKLLCSLCSHITLIEHNRDALVFATQNLQDIPCDFYGVSGAVFAKEHCANAMKNNGKFDVAIIDPPRIGAERQVLLCLCEAMPKLILYLSCNVSCAAKDCTVLMKAGYKMKDFYLLDFFPQTPHTESLCVLQL